MESFRKKVVMLLPKIPQGKLTTYKAIGHTLGTRAYRAVGHALHTNEEPEKYPCYKVVCSNGKIGGYADGVSEKIKRLNKDGIKIKDGQIVDFKKHLHTF